MADKQDKKYIGIREVAKLAGVSIATVSRVLNTPELTSERTRKKVMKVIDEYDYVPNQAAINLFSGDSNSIAIFVYDMANPLYTSITYHLNRIAFENDYILIICDVGNSREREEKYYNYCKSIRTKGIIYTAGSSNQFTDKEHSRAVMPIVFYDRNPFNTKDFYSIRSDHVKGMELLVDYLYQLNHRKIGHIAGELSIRSAKERLNAFKSSMENKHLDVPPQYIAEGGFSVQSGTKAFDYFSSLSDPPTAIIAANDECARGFIMQANARSIKIPEMFSVCGYNGLYLDAFLPSLTTIYQDTEKIAETMFDLIINASENPPPKDVVIDVSMHVGDTCRKI